MIVFWGLVKEKRAERLKVPERFEKAFPDVADSTRQLAESGWKTLMLGIGIEIVAAFALNIASLIELRHIEHEIASNDPRNQPVETAIASATILFREDPTIHFSESDFWFILTADFLHATNAIATMGGNTWAPEPKVTLHCSSFRRFQGNRGTTVWIEFAKGGPMNDQPFPTMLVGEMSDWNDALIWLPYSGEPEVVNGSITLTLNTSSKIFKIPAQKLVTNGPIQVFEGTNSLSK